MTTHPTPDHDVPSASTLPPELSTPPATCADVQAWLPAWLLGEDDSHSDIISEHMKHCVDCRAARDRLHPDHCAITRTWIYESLRGDTSPELTRHIETHLERCALCREEARTIRALDRECYRHLAPYRLSRSFVRSALRNWHPTGEHHLAMTHHRGFAAHIERAAHGNQYAQERLVEEFGSYIHIRTFLATGDFHWASEAAMTLCRAGFSTSCIDMSRKEFLAWLDGECLKQAKTHPWYGETFVAPTPGSGLASGKHSAKLQHHRLIFDTIRAMEPTMAFIFLHSYVQHEPLASVAALLDIPKNDVIRLRQEARAHMQLALENIID